MRRCDKRIISLLLVLATALTFCCCASSCGKYEKPYKFNADASGGASEAEAGLGPAPEVTNNPDAAGTDSKVIYLTFDDGPGPYTSALLDVLKRYNVKATFFVTGAWPDYYDMIGRAYDEGNSVGVHSFSHDYRKIYDSEEAFFDDFDAMEDIIKEQTGKKTKLLRFPGGSSNTVSSFNPGIMSALTAEVEDRGYTYVDWNVYSGDAGETTDTETIKQNVENGCLEHQSSIVLQHDIKDYSVSAVEDIIVWGLNNGYVFLPLDEDSPTAHHVINN